MSTIESAPKSEWIWMPHPGHLIVAANCRFHLNTMVNGFIVSTVGEYLPDSNVRELLASSRGRHLEGIGDERLADWMRKYGYEKIGCDRLYETMVFRAIAAPATQCCPFTIDGDDLDFAGYNDAASARIGHMQLCEKYASIQPT